MVIKIIQHALLGITTLFLLCSLSQVKAQNNVGIGTTSPNSKAILELKATDKGFIAPRMTNTQMLAIPVTATESALLIYNIDSACYHFYNGTAWQNLCKKNSNALDTAAINAAIKNYLNSNATTIINILKGDTALFNYTSINQANINILTVDTSITNVAIINNAIINTLTVDSSTTNYASINQANINIANIDTSIINYASINQANINNATIDSSTINYANINNAVIDSLQANYISSNTGNFNTLNVGGQNIMQTMSDSINSQAWLLKGNTATNASTNFIGTIDAQDLVLKTNSIENLRITSGGNVGVGTNAPTSKLHLYNGALQITNPNGLQETYLTQDGGLELYRDPTSTIGPEISGYIDFKKTKTNDVDFRINYDNTLGTNGGLMFLSTITGFAPAASRMVILNQNGNVGIGTNLPAYKLHVPSGYIGTDYINTTDNAVGAGVTGIMVKQGDDFLRTGNAASVLSFLGITAPAGDNLGNHTATTALNMNNHVINNAQGSSTFAQSNNTSLSFIDAPIQLREAQFGSSGAFLAPRLGFHWAGVVASQIGMESSGRIAILNNPGTGYENFVANETYTNGWFRNINANSGLYNEVTGTGIFSPSAGVMAIYNNGSLGIGTTTPTAKLDVAGTARIQTLPAGANTESVVTVDGAGNLHKKAAGFTGATYVGTAHTGDLGLTQASVPVTGVFTSCSVSTVFLSPSRDIVTFNFPNLGTTNYVVIATAECSSCATGTSMDYSNEISRVPLISQKTATSFTLFIEESGNIAQDLTWNIMIITY